MNPSSESKRIIVTALMIFFAGTVVYNIGLGPVNGAGIIYCGGILYWTRAVFRRPVHPGIRGRIAGISALMLLLMALRSTRYLYSGILSPDILRRLWYLYYLPFTMIPLLGLDASLLIWNGEDKRSWKLMLLLYALCMSLNLLILTNDAHELAFRFTEGGRQTEQALRYDYGPLYYAAALWIAGCVFAMLRHLMSETKAAGGSGIPKALLPVLIVPSLYFITYYLGQLPLLRGRRFLQLPEAYCLFFICIMECCLLTGWFPIRILKEKESEVRAGATEFEKKNRLYESMAASVMPQLSEVGRILSLEAQYEDEEFRREMAKACVLTAYIKRRCNLILKTEEEGALSPEELRLSVAESLEYLRLTGVTGAVFLEGSGEALCGSLLSSAYDLFEHAAEAAMQGAEALLVNIVSGEKGLLLRMTLEKPRGFVTEGQFPEAAFSREDDTCFIHRTFTAGEAAEEKEKDAKGTAHGPLPGAVPEPGDGTEPLSREFSVLSGMIRDYTIEKEKLDARIRLHDDLGKMLLLARRYIQGRESRQSMLSVWLSGSRLLEEEPEADITADPYAYMALVAKDVGIRLAVEGELPKAPGTAEVVSAAIHECLTNTIRHAEGDELRIRCLAGRIEFTNNGKPPQEEIQESGGLGMLRKMALARGIGMQVDSFPVFRLTLFIESHDPEQFSR